MATYKNVKIFTGFVEQEQLEKDMHVLKSNLGGLRSIFRGRGIRLRTEQCDSEDLEEIKSAIEGSDVCIFLFMTELSAQTNAQFDCAYDRLLSDDEETRPSILVWFRESDDVPMSEELGAFRGRLRGDIGHFVNRYADIDTVQFQLLLHLEREGAGVPFVWVGTKLLDARGNVVMDFAETAAYTGNEMLQAVRRRLDEYEARQQELLERELDDELTDDELDELDEVTDKIAQATEEEAKLQERFLSDMRQFVSELADDRQMSPRRRKAIQLISVGRVREGYELLDTRDIERDTRAHEERAKMAAAEAQSERGWVMDGVKQLLMNVQLLRTFVEEEGGVKDDEIRHSYAVAIAFEERNGFEPLATVGYGEYLVGLGVYDKAIDLLDGACAWYRRALERVQDVQYGMYVAPDPYLPGVDGLRRGLAHALDLLSQGEGGADAASSAAYAVSERIDILRELCQPDDVAYGSEDFADDLVDAAHVMVAADRPDDGLEYLEQACELLEDEIEEEAEYERLDSLAKAIEMRRELLAELGQSNEANAMSRRLLDILRREVSAYGNASVEDRLTKELRDEAHDAIGRGDEQAARDLALEALEVERKRVESEPSTNAVISFSTGLCRSSVIAARLHDSDWWTRCNAQRLHVLVVEYRRLPTIELQKAIGSCVDELIERWESRMLRDSAVQFLPELVAVADALEGIAAPGEDIFYVGTVVGNAVMGAVAMMGVVGGTSSESEKLLSARLDRLRAGSAEGRGLCLYSTAFERIARRIQDAGRIPFAYGLASERLSALRLACGLETTGEPEYARTTEDLARLRVLIRALGYAALYAREHGRPAEGNALLEERLGLLRESFVTTRSLAEAYGLNKALIESSEQRLARGDRAGMDVVLGEAWGHACDLHADQASEATLRNLLYVGKRVDHRYREAGDVNRAEEILRTCVERLVAYYKEHSDPDMAAYAAHVAWMYVVELRDADGGSEALACDVLSTFEWLAAELAAMDMPAYLAYLKHRLNPMVDKGKDDENRRGTIELVISVAEKAYRDREAAGKAQPDDLRTLSSVYELGILVAFGRGFDDQAEEYVSRCIALYEGRYEQALSQGGGEGVALSPEECASQLSKQLTRFAKDMRRFGHPERADELGSRSTQILAELHEANPRSRVSFVYSAQLHNDSRRLIKEGRIDEGIELRHASTEVLDRYRRADPTDRNLLWYTRSLMDLARTCRENGRADEADAAEQRAIDALAERYEASRSLMLLARYLYAMSKVASRLQKNGDDGRALDMYRDCERLATEAFHRSPSVEAGRLLGLMQTYLYKQLLKMRMKDEVRELTTREVEVQRYLFANGRTVHGAKIFAAALHNESRRLRWLSRNLGRRDYYEQALDLQAERVEVMRWLAQRDTESARQLARELTKEITVIDPQDPWILKSMRKFHGVGHYYPLDTGAYRAHVCQEALMHLYREEPSVELENRICDMKGVRVQFLQPARRIEKGGELESHEALVGRLRQAANELYELVPLLEDRYTRERDEANAYRLTYYLKLASVVFEDIERQEDALDVLSRRRELLSEQYALAGDLTALVKYSHALKDQAQLLSRMGQIDEALRIEARRERICRTAMAGTTLDEAEREQVELELMECLKHREVLFHKKGEGVLEERTVNLESYVELLRKQHEAHGIGAMQAQDSQVANGVDEADDTDEDQPADGMPMGESEEDETPAGAGDTTTSPSWTISLAINLGRLAACRRDLGEISAAISTYNESIRLLRSVEASVGSESTGAKVHQGLRTLLAERAVLLAEQLGTDASPDGAGMGGKRELVVKAALDEALGDEPALTELPQEDALVYARLHQQRRQLLCSMGDLEMAVLDAEAAVECLEAAGEESVSPIEHATALAEWGKALAECGRTEESEAVRERKTEFLRRAYSQDPDPALGLYLGIDLAQRVSTAESSGQIDVATELTLERLELLSSVVPADADQLKRWRLQFKNTVKKLIAFAQVGDECGAADEALARAEGYLARRVGGSERDHLAASSHLDILACAIRADAAEFGSTARLERLGRYGRQTLRYAFAGVLEPGIFTYHARNAADAFASEGALEDSSYMLSSLRDVLESQWKAHHDAAVGDALYKLYADLLEEGSDAEVELVLLRNDVHLAKELRCRGLSAIGDKRIYHLYERMEACANEAGAPLDAVTAGLALIDRDYELAERDDVMLEPLADGMSGHLREMADKLKEQRCGRESARLEYDARNCGKNLGKPGWNWWRQGYKNAGRPWRRESELGVAQKRLQRASHVLRLSLELGDWFEKREDHRNLRNLFQLRYEAYRKGQDQRGQLKALTRLRWCLFNAATTLYRHRYEAEGLLAESIVLRLEMLEVLADMAQLTTDEAKARQVKQEQVKALRTLAGQLQGDEYEGLGYADVRSWALEQAKEAQEELNHSTRRHQ